jgi:hypothetical protein
MVPASYLFYWEPKCNSGVPLMLVFVTGVRGRNLATTAHWHIHGSVLSIGQNLLELRISLLMSVNNVIHCKVEIK